MDKLQEIALYCGISINDFWDLTIAEIKLIVKVENQKTENRTKEEARKIYSLASLIGVAFASNNPLCNGKVKYPKIYEVFPSLFEAEKPQQQDWRIAKERLLNFANAHNAKRGENNK